eukprot:10543682-Ditylum_brightwellii.AAC.1
MGLKTNVRNGPMACCQHTIYSYVFVYLDKTRQNKWPRYPEVWNNKGKQYGGRGSLYKNRKNYNRKPRMETDIQTDIDPNTFYLPDEYHANSKGKFLENIHRHTTKEKERKGTTDPNLHAGTHSKTSITLPHLDRG